uniref:Uncharacterized protein n=1 Tax=Panagrolaimus davidi TaxID=227884 RepID=A0A914PI02_9BILA
MNNSEALYDFYFNSNISFLYDFILTTVCFFSTIICGIVLTIAFTKSRRLGMFKWIIISNICASYSVNLSMTAFKIRPLFPAMAFAFKSPFGALQYPRLATIGFDLAIVYKYLCIFPMESSKKFKNSYFVFAIFGSILLTIIFVLFCLALAIVDSSEILKQQKIINQNFPMIQKFVGKCLLIVFNTNLSFYFKIISASILSSYGIAIISFIRMKIKLNDLNKSMNRTTFRLQLMLFYSVIAETTSAAVLLGFPATISLLSASYDYKNSGILSIFCLTIMSFHSIVSNVLTVITVKPYSRALKIYFKKFKIIVNGK